jgi:hypothetical protein
MPRPSFRVKEEDRQLVRSMAALGLRQEQIAKTVGLRSPKTLRKHFGRELQVLGQYLERFGTIDLRKLDEASLPKSLSILGLEGSREGCSGLWVFKHRIQPVSSERREKWVGELEVKFPCWVSRAERAHVG